jgi:glycosyltransferase involved in cell wall biosynthesis
MAKALTGRGHIVHLFGGRPAGALPEISGVQVHTFPYVPRKYIPNFGTRFRKFMERVSFGCWAWRDLARGGYDYIYLVKPFDIPAALLVRRLSGARIIFASGGTEFFSGYAYLVRRLDYFFACSDYNASQIESYCGQRPVVLPNGVNTALFRPRPARADLKAGLGLEPGDLVLISACRLVGLKGLDHALRAMALLRDRGHRLRYLIIGEGPARRELEELARRLDLSGRVVFTGSLANALLPDYYALADVAVYPSVGAETFGIAMGEALACGVPVVSTRVGGIPDVVVDGTGLLVPPKDEKALAGAIGEFLDRPDFRRSCGERGRAWISGNLSWSACAERLEKHLAGG